MKTVFYLYIALLSFSVQAQSYQLNLESSTLNWTGKAAFNAYALSGTLKAKLGHLTLVNDSITALDVVVNMLSLDHENKDLKSHLRSKDFFEVKKYQEAQFIVSNVPIIKSGEMQVEGQMKIKDKSKLEKLRIRIVKEDRQIRLSFKTTLNRLAYGVTYNSPSLFKKLKQNAIADEFVLEGALVFVEN